ncbi:MAG: HU family DNA-binding protein [Cyanobacteriota bacterium]|jgi:hypothetical protein
MNLREMINSITEETGLPREHVRKVLTAQFSHMADLIRRKEDFTSPSLGIKALTNRETGRQGGWVWIKPKDHQ